MSPNGVTELVSSYDYLNLHKGIFLKLCCCYMLTYYVEQRFTTWGPFSIDTVYL